MFTPNRDTFSEITDIVLYRYNSVDSKIWALIRKTNSFRNLDSDSILVEASAVRSILLNNFRKEI